MLFIAHVERYAGFRRPNAPADLHETFGALRVGAPYRRGCRSPVGGVDAHRAGRRPLWFDETVSVEAAKLPATSLARYVATTESNMSLYHVLLHLWLLLDGSDVFARSLSVIFGLATLPVVYALARRLFDTRTAVIAVLFMAANLNFVGHAREARGYYSRSCSSLRRRFSSSWRSRTDGAATGRSMRSRACSPSTRTCSPHWRSSPNSSPFSFSGVGSPRAGWWSRWRAACCCSSPSPSLWSRARKAGKSIGSQRPTFASCRAALLVHG